MSAEVGWEFPVDAADQWRGFNDAGIEHFRGSPFASLAREILQNSMDAADAGQDPISDVSDVKERGLGFLQWLRLD
jgi:hypothetical protein